MGTIDRKRSRDRGAVLWVRLRRKGDWRWQLVSGGPTVKRAGATTDEEARKFIGKGRGTEAST